MPHKRSRRWFRLTLSTSMGASNEDETIGVVVVDMARIWTHFLTSGSWSYVF